MHRRRKEVELRNPNVSTEWSFVWGALFDLFAVTLSHSARWQKAVEIEPRDVI